MHIVRNIILFVKIQLFGLRLVGIGSMHVSRVVFKGGVGFLWVIKVSTSLLILDSSMLGVSLRAMSARKGYDT